MLLYGSDPTTEAVLETRKVDLPAGAGAVAIARDHVARALVAWEWERCTDLAALCVSEVVTALLALDSESLQLVLLRSSDQLTVELRACRARKRFSTSIGEDAARARGIAVIDDLVPLWGVRPADDGEAIWFELR